MSRETLIRAALALSRHMWGRCEWLGISRARPQLAIHFQHLDMVLASGNSRDCRAAVSAIGRTLLSCRSLTDDQLAADILRLHRLASQIGV
jgi:hypothetical protein